MPQSKQTPAEKEAARLLKKVNKREFGYSWLDTVWDRQSKDVQAAFRKLTEPSKLVISAGPPDGSPLDELRVDENGQERECSYEKPEKVLDLDAESPDELIYDAVKEFIAPKSLIRTIEIDDDPGVQTSHYEVRVGRHGITLTLYSSVD